MPVRAGGAPAIGTVVCVPWHGAAAGGASGAVPLGKALPSPVRAIILMAVRRDDSAATVRPMGCTKAAGTKPRARQRSGILLRCNATYRDLPHSPARHYAFGREALHEDPKKIGPIPQIEACGPAPAAL